MKFFPIKILFYCSCSSSIRTPPVIILFPFLGFRGLVGFGTCRTIECDGVGAQIPFVLKPNSHSCQPSMLGNGRLARFGWAVSSRWKWNSKGRSLNDKRGGKAYQQEMSTAALSRSQGGKCLKLGEIAVPAELLLKILHSHYLNLFSFLSFFFPLFAALPFCALLAWRLTSRCFSDF